MTDSSKSFQLNETSSDTLVIHCADPRFRAAFEEYIKIKLRIEHYILISIAGGAGAFVSRDSTTSEVKVILEDLRLFLAGPELRRVLAFNHDLCLWYGKQLPDLDDSLMGERQIDDLGHFAHAIETEYSRLRVETYMAVVAGESVKFKSVK